MAHLPLQFNRNRPFSSKTIFLTADAGQLFPGFVPTDFPISRFPIFILNGPQKFLFFLSLCTETIHIETSIS